jgi:hypothetical protein
MITPVTDTAAPEPTSADRRGALAAAYDHADAVAAGVRTDQLSGSTPCPDYDVATLVSHWTEVPSTWPVGHPGVR